MRMAVNADTGYLLIEDQPVARSGEFLTRDHSSTMVMPANVLGAALKHFCWKPIVIGHGTGQIVGSTLDGARLAHDQVLVDCVLWDNSFLDDPARELSPSFKWRDARDSRVREIEHVNHIGIVAEGRLGLQLGRDDNGPFLFLTPRARAARGLGAADSARQLRFHTDHRSILDRRRDGTLV
jgi:hypothetical protein